MRIQLNPNKKQEVGRQFSNFKISCENTSKAVGIDQYARPDINLCNYVRMGASKRALRKAREKRRTKRGKAAELKRNMETPTLND